MRRLLIGVPAAALLAAAACSPPGSGVSSTPAAPGASPSATTVPAGLTQDACRVLTAADVRAALGVQVNQLPMTSPPPGGGPDSSLVSGCTYASATASTAGASLYLFRDMPIDYFASVPGFQKVPGVGDAAFMQASMLIGRKGHVTFQLTIVSDGDQQAKTQQLTALARVVAGRL